MAEHDSWTPELEEALAAPFPNECITWLEKKSLKTGKVTQIATVSWYHYAQRLDDLVGAGGWQSRIAHMHEAGGRLVIALELTVLGITKTNVGDEPDDSDGFGSVSTNAYAQAFKRAATMFGIARDQLYAKKGRAAATQPAKKPRKSNNAPVKSEASPPDYDHIPERMSDEHGGKYIGDESIPISWFMKRVDDTRYGVKWRAEFKREIQRRQDLAGVKE